MTVVVKKIKKVGRAWVVTILGWQIRRLRARYSFKIIGIVGSYGKTSTASAIATVMQAGMRVAPVQNYNDLLAVPLVAFGEAMPSLLNPIGWLGVFIRNEMKLQRPYPYDVLIVELGTDGPGQIAEFAQYLTLDIAVVTSIGPEHMAFFADVHAVAREELSVERFSKRVLVNTDLCAAEYLHYLTNPYLTYGFAPEAQNHIDSMLGTISHGKTKQQLYSAASALIVARLLGMHDADIMRGINAIKPVQGRMQELRGIRGSTILDETYNASPETMRAALDVLYGRAAPHKVALLGSMNEMGTFSKGMHEEVGAYCDPAQLELVITFGTDANAYLAPAAAARGCVVKTFTKAADAGAYLHDYLKEGTIILAKGSQNGVFAEEAVKKVLADEKDAARLVRQSPEWMRKKKQAGIV